MLLLRPVAFVEHLVGLLERVLGEVEQQPVAARGAGVLPAVARDHAAPRQVDAVQEAGRRGAVGTDRETGRGGICCR